MRQLTPVAVAGLLIGGCAVAAAATPVAVFPINEESLAQLRKQYPLATAEVEDPVYKRKQQYQGFWLRDVLKNLNREGHSEADLYLRFRCKDGYLPMMPLARAVGAKGLVAVRDLRAPQGKEWEPLPGSNPPSTMAPSYLVWLSPNAAPDEFPWPYQMVAIELVTSSDALAELNPGTRQPGFELFVTHCLKCHAINGVGGTFGPELNSPCSVTEYWNLRLLARFIANASSIRAATKMPSFESLPQKDIQELIEYLQSMTAHKKPGAACP